MPLETSSRVGSGFFSSRTLPAMTMPGMQKPHCTAPASPKASTYTSFSRSLSPSVVVISWFSKVAALREHDFTSLPPAMTTQVPHVASSQPSLTDSTPISSRRTESRGLSSVTEYSWSFTVIFMTVLLLGDVGVGWTAGHELPRCEIVGEHPVADDVAAAQEHVAHPALDLPALVRCVVGIVMEGVMMDGPGWSRVVDD